MLTEQQLVKMYPFILRQARRLDRQNFEDLAQEAALRCWARREEPEFNEDEVFLRYRLKRVVHDVYVEGWRRAGRDLLFDALPLDGELSVSEQGEGDGGATMPAEKIGSPPRADTIVEVREALERVRRHPHGELMMFYVAQNAGDLYRGPSGSDTWVRASKVFGLKKGTVVSRTHAVRKAIRAQMEAA